MCGEYMPNRYFTLPLPCALAMASSAPSPCTVLPPILFVDSNPAFSEAIREILTKDEETRLTTDTCIITKDYPKTKGDCFVSPANSIGYMDGGVDDALRHLLPGVEFENSKRNGEMRCYVTVKKTSYLPIGSARVLECGDCFLISAPTMWVPQDVSNTNNVYWAMRATFSAVTMWNACYPKHTIKRLICPGMGTGYGCMPFAESAQQIMRAYREFDSSQFTGRQKILFGRHHCYLDEPNPEEQPRTKDNIEWYSMFWAARAAAAPKAKAKAEAEATNELSDTIAKLAV